MFALRSYFEQVLRLREDEEPLLENRENLGALARERLAIQPTVKPDFWTKKTVAPLAPEKEFFRRISDSEMTNLTTKAKSTRSATPEELEDFSKERLEAPIFQTSEWIWVAFKAYLEKGIGLDAITNLFLYDACQKETREEDPKAPFSSAFGARRLYIYRLFKGKAAIVLRHATADYLDKLEFTALLKRLEQLEPTGVQFFVIQRRENPMMNKIIDPIHEGGYGINLMTIQGRLPEEPNEIEGLLWQIIVPPKMMEAIHQSKRGSHPCRFRCALGFAERESFSDYNSRVVFIPSIAQSPSCIHGYRIKPLIAYHHDAVYHHAVEAANMHRAVWTALANFLKTQEDLSWLAPLFLDRDLANYLYRRREIDADNFWIGLYEMTKLVKRQSRNEHTSDRFLACFGKFYAENRRQLEKHGFRPYSDLRRLMQDVQTGSLPINEQEFTLWSVKLGQSLINIRTL